MNKGFLILEDGRVLSGRTALTQNVFGKVHMSGLSAKLTSTVDEFSFTLDQAHGSNEGMIGKIVVDALPLEYHMYDVKNALM